MTGDLEKIIEANRGMCICDSCPTYNECMRSDESLLFCVTGKSATCTFDKKGCLCPPCPVTKALGLKKAYYCIKGSEKEQH
jgi:Cft2 family RNA processing exonuclease